MRPLPWSFTAISGFNSCPKQYSEVKVYKHFKDDMGEAAIWGDWVHKQIEAHYRELVPYHENMRAYLPHVEAAVAWTGGWRTNPGSPDGRGRMLMVEHKMGINTKLKKCDFFDPKVFGRAIADFLVVDNDVAWCIDWKTGKVKPDNRQLKLFAIFVFTEFPYVNEVHTSFEWLMFAPQNTRKSFHRRELTELWASFMPDLTQIRDAFATETWQAKPSGLCNGWCPVTNCQHWKPKR
jgi:hypothetical protein